MSAPNDGGPAFPTQHVANGTTVKGMTLRQFYAGQILAGFCSNPSVFAPNANHGWSLVNATDEDLVGYAHFLASKLVEADALLSQRTTGGGK